MCEQNFPPLCFCMCFRVCASRCFFSLVRLFFSLFVSCLFTTKQPKTQPLSVCFIRGGTSADHGDEVLRAEQPPGASPRWLTTVHDTSSDVHVVAAACLCVVRALSQPEIIR